MAISKLTLKVKVAWWFKYYAFGVILLNHPFGLDPNWEKVDYWTRKACKVVK